MKVYVSLAENARGGGPASGSQRWDVPVEIPDASRESYELAIVLGARKYQERFCVVAKYGVFHFGTFQ